MILIDGRGLSAARPGRTLFADLDLTISTGDRLAVVGLNGTGKSTLIDVLTGVRDPDAGEVRRGREVRVAALEQVPVLHGHTVRDALHHGDLANEWEIEAVADRLGIGALLDRRCSNLSGGQKKRISLARALVADADLLVLDEPTNHLDIDAITWLEERLSHFRGALLLVTHDRHFLDRVTNRILELDRGGAFLHNGGYGSYLDAKADRESGARRAEATRANLARRELAWLRRGAPARTSKPKARIAKATELVNRRPDDPIRPEELPLLAATPRLGDRVIELHGVGHTFPADAAQPAGAAGTAAAAALELFSGLELLLDNRERLGIVGSNGAGKSTLLDIMAGRTEPTEGSVVHGSTAVVEVFDQQGRELDPTLRLRDAVVGPDGQPSHLHGSLMEAFWFDEDTQWAPIELLSGGERRRLQLLMTLARQPNVLLLDEPTNDLDLDTLRQLEDFLEVFPGAVVVVSHDRAFLERVVADVLVIDSGTARKLPGGYAAYESERERLRGSRKAAPVVGGSASIAAERPAMAPPTSGVISAGSTPKLRSPSTMRHKMRAAERAMADAKSAVESLLAEVEQAGTSGDHQILSALGADLEAAHRRSDEAEEEWLALAAEMEHRGLDF